MNTNLTIVDLSPVDATINYEHLVRTMAPAIAAREKKNLAGAKEFDFALENPGMIPLGNEGDIIVFAGAIHGGGYRVRVLLQQGWRWCNSFGYLNYSVNNPASLALVEHSNPLSLRA